MKEAYAQGAVEAEWTLSDYDVVDIDGDVNQEAFESVDDEQGKLISAALSCPVANTDSCTIFHLWYFRMNWMQESVS